MLFRLTITIIIKNGYFYAIEKIRHFIFIKIIIAQVFVLCNILGAKFIYILENLPCRLRKAEKNTVYPVWDIPYSFKYVSLYPCPTLRLRAGRNTCRLGDARNEGTPEIMIKRTGRLLDGMIEKALSDWPRPAGAISIFHAPEVRFISKQKRCCYIFINTYQCLSILLL